MIYIANEGALFRGPARAWPKEVWNGREFVPYKGAVPKGIEWGEEVDEAEAQQLMGAEKQVEAAEPQKGAA